MKQSRSISWRLRLGFLQIGAVASSLLLLFIVFDLDRLFDAHYRQLGLTGLAFEIGDHVILPMIALLLPMMIATPLMIHNALRPLADAATRIDAASGMDRGIRVGVSGLPPEAVPFVTAVNDLLSRLDEAAARHESFAADVAHELKTPLSILRLAVDRHGGPLAWEIRGELNSMNRLVDQLLLLAQLDAEAAAHAPREEICLARLAEDVASRLAPIAISDNRALALEVEEKAIILGRREAVASALSNLVENALRFVPEEAAVTIIVGPGRQVRVRDHGPGISPAELETLKQRHQRSDRASVGGAGLGMAIVSRIMAAHGGSLETDPAMRELKLQFT